MSKSRKKHQYRQVAALPYRLAEDGHAEVALVTSRGTGRWILPKGWPIKGKNPAEAARTEAFEEAGLTGVVSKRPVGRFIYEKLVPNRSLTIEVDVFSLKVSDEFEEYPEKGQRTVEWLPIDAAASRASIPEVADVIRHFAIDLSSPASGKGRLKK